MISGAKIATSAATIPMTKASMTEIVMSNDEVALRSREPAKTEK